MTRLMADPEFRRYQVAHRLDPHIGPINRYVESLRQPQPPDGRGWVPDVPPHYGGIGARILTLFRDPGPKTHPDFGGSGFISYENDDATAELACELVEFTGLGGSAFLTWNVYPWWMNRKPTTSELDAGGEALAGLLELLPDLRLVILHGGEAAGGWKRLARRRPDIRIPSVTTYHTSRQAFWHRDAEVRAARRQHLFDTYRAAAALVGSASSG